MQTFPTHVVGGLVVSQALLTVGLVSVDAGSALVLVPLLWLCGIAGAVLPDVPYAFYYIVYDKILRVPPATYAYRQGWPITIAKELSHSIPAWLFALALVLLFVPTGTLFDLALTFVLAGLIAGVLPDIPSHAEEQYKDTDCGFLWPLPWRLRWPNARWEYRKAASNFSMKPWERKLGARLFLAFLGLLALYLVI